MRFKTAGKTMRYLRRHGYTPEQAVNHALTLLNRGHVSWHEHTTKNARWWVFEQYLPKEPYGV